MKRIAIRYGLYMFAGFVALFLISAALGLSDNYNLRMLNGLIHLSLLYYAVRAFRAEHPDSIHNYLSGTAQGMYAGMLGALMFTVFMILYLAFNPAFLAELRDITPLGNYLTPITAGAILLLEGLIVSLIGSYIMTRLVDARLERKGIPYAR